LKVGVNLLERLESFLEPLEPNHHHQSTGESSNQSSEDDEEEDDDRFLGEN
jgi:hypothetical protein